MHTCRMPQLGALSLTTDHGLTGPVWVAGVRTAIAIVVMAFTDRHLAADTTNV